LNTISQTMLNKRDEFVFTKGDSVIFNITVKERDLVKDLTGCNFSLLLSYEGGQYPLEQKSVTIVNAIEGKIQIKLESYMTNKLGINVFQLLIIDSDEQIATNRFRFSCVEGLSDGVVEEAQESIDTITQLNLLLDEYINQLEVVKQTVDNQVTHINNKFVEVDTRFDSMDARADGMDNRLDGIDNKIGRLPQIIDLIPTQIQGSSIIYLITPEIKMSALELLKCRFMVSVSGRCLNETTVQTAIGTLYFNMMNDSKGVPTIYMYLDTISDRGVQNRTVNMSAVFGDGGTTIPASASTFKISIKSNISSNLNYLSGVNGTLSSIANNLKF
ncbi:MAG: BppU family phage baseplate upper protein, partial [Peptostreptococcaceae bacterium]